MEKEIEITARIILQLYSPNGAGLHTTKAKAIDYVSEKPLLNDFSRWQAGKMDIAVNFYGVGLNVPDDFTRKLLELLDGTRNRNDLKNDLTEFVKLNEEISDKEAFLANLAENLDRDLFVMAKMGFFIA